MDLIRLEKILNGIKSEFERMIRENVGGASTTCTPQITLKGLPESDLRDIAINLHNKTVCGRYHFSNYQFGREIDYSQSPPRDSATLKISIDASY